MILSTLNAAAADSVVVTGTVTLDVTNTILLSITLAAAIAAIVFIVYHEFCVGREREPMRQFRGTD